MWRFGPNDAASCVIIDILFFHCSFVDMLNIISTCRDILCVDINVDKSCVDHSTTINWMRDHIKSSMAVTGWETTRPLLFKGIRYPIIVKGVTAPCFFFFDIKELL